MNYYMKNLKIFPICSSFILIQFRVLILQLFLRHISFIFRHLTEDKLLTNIILLQATVHSKTVTITHDLVICYQFCVSVCAFALIRHQVL